VGMWWLSGDVVAQLGMWWLSGDVVAHWGCGGSVGYGYGDWVNQTATQKFRVRSRLPLQSPEGQQEL
jgi:hypothetical protein